VYFWKFSVTPLWRLCNCWELLHLVGVLLWGIIKYDCVRSIVMDSSISCYVPVCFFEVLSSMTVSGLLLWIARSVAMFLSVSVLQHSLWLTCVTRQWWSLWQPTFDSQFLTDNAGLLLLLLFLGVAFFFHALSLWLVMPRIFFMSFCLSCWLTFWAVEHSKNSHHHHEDHP